MMSPTEVDAWNDRYPVGTLIEVHYAPGPHTCLARTTSPLSLWGTWEIVEIDRGGCVTLDRVRVVDQTISYTPPRERLTL